MIRKSMPSGYDPTGGRRFSEKIMLKQGAGARWRSRSSAAFSRGPPCFRAVCLM